MVRITKVYTKTGDKGMTRLAGGQEISKGDLRIESYGTVDELNAWLGIVAELLREDDPGRLRTSILRIQNKLFDLGSQLAVLPEDRRENTPVVISADIEKLETEIDEMNNDLPMLKSFILPGGGIASAYLHVARTVCRRAERTLVRLEAIEALDGTEMIYLNRLSDWFFVASRYAAMRAGVAETLWQPGGNE